MLGPDRRLREIFFEEANGEKVKNLGMIAFKLVKSPVVWGAFNQNISWIYFLKYYIELVLLIFVLGAILV